MKPDAFKLALSARPKFVELYLLKVAFVVVPAVPTAVPPRTMRVFAVVVSRGEIFTDVALTPSVGFPSSYKRTVIVSYEVVISAVTVKDAAVVVSDLTAEAVVPLINVALPAVGVEIATLLTVAVDGAMDNIPSPKAETTTSARRLKFVLLDICFLSLVVKKTFFFTAGKEKFFAT